jgi:glycosyltransferase involved in cell wall biosynthesis
MLPQISVVIPAYNAERWIGETLNCILAQDYPPDLLEIAVVDDGSSDRTIECARAVLKQGPLEWSIQSCSHGGPARARNIGISSTRGQWIQFLDADDLLAKDKIKHQGLVAQYASPKAAVVYSPWTVIEEENGIWIPRLPLRTPRIESGSVLDLLKTENFIATGSQLFSRHWLNRVGGFDERHSFVEDVDLELRVGIAGGEFVATTAAAPLFLYRKCCGSLSQRDPIGFWEGCVRNARLAEDHCCQIREGLTPEQKDLLLKIYGNALRVFYDLDRSRFRELFDHVKGLDPAYRPTAPGILRCLSSLVGYEAAEAFASLYRQLKYTLETLY